MARRWPTISATAFVTGTLDMLAACLYYFVKSGDTRFYLIPSSVASALFGKSAFSGGMIMPVIGLFMHYAIAFFWTLLFFYLYPKLDLFRKNRLLTAVIYGVFVWIVMNRIGLPLTRVAHRPFDPVNAGINIGILILCIGTPVVLIASKLYRKSHTSPSAIISK